MATTRSAGLSELAKYGFVDLSETVSKLDQLVSSVGDSGRSALAAIAQSANPDQALNGLLDFAAEHKVPLKKLLQKADSAMRICKVFGASSAMIDFLRRHPNRLAIFESSQKQPDGFAEFRSSIAAEVAPYITSEASINEAWKALRVGYRSQLLRIAIFDLEQEDQQAGLPIVAAALADLAGATLDVALDIARAELLSSGDFGQYSPRELADTRVAVIGMGKCGARELNYISDVDVIFVAESSSADLSNERALDVATKLVTRMMRAVDGTCDEPMLWQVDPNLRPEGKSGALVRTLESHVAYYERWAQSWEFQALLKARPIAGDIELGNRYVEALSPKVWSSAARENFVESVQAMRERVMEHIPRSEVDLQIKLGPGGLRDIEFTVQLLQLVHGRTDSSVRHRDTISAIESLAGASYIGRTEAEQFSRHYRYLRLLEHRIQLSQMRRTHLMPTSETTLRSLARSIDLKSTADDLLGNWNSVKTEVRSLHQKLFYRPLLSAVSRLDDSSLELSSDQAQARLAAIGFIDPKGALGHIAALTSGLSRRASIQRQLLPVLLQWFAEGTDPDAALLAFRRLSEDLGESHWYLRMLRDSSGAAERMTQVLSNSRLATALFERIPEAAAWFEHANDLVPTSPEELEIEIDALLERHTDADSAASAIRQMRRRETLRLAMGAVLGELSLSEISAGLSDLTACYLNSMLRVAIRLSGAELAAKPIDEILDFGIVAMGRFGGEELGFGSDADVIYFYEVVGDADPSEAQKVSERIVAEIKRLCTDQLLEFEIDIDLRPEGKNGPVTRSIDSYEAYYKRWSDTWEAQALLRARVIAGSRELRERFESLIDRYRYPSKLPDAAIIEIRRIKARVETERLPQGADPLRHLKLGRGSLSDVEWLVQLIQLRHGHEYPSIRTPKTLEALDACVEANLLEDHDARVLKEAWLLASRIRSAMVLWDNRKSDVLPTDRRQLEGIARILEYPRGSATTLESDYLARTRRARMVFERIFYK